MAGFISNQKKAAYGNVFNKLHDTFSRPITIWKTPERIVISSDPGYNFLYNEQESINVEYVPVSGVFDARILWMDPSKLSDQQEIREEIRGNVCRLKIKKDALDFLDDAEKIEIDGKIVQQFGSSKPHGLFEVDFYTLYFKESN